MKSLLLITALLFSHLRIVIAQSANTIDCAYVTTSADPDLAQLQPRGKRAYEKDNRIFIAAASLNELEFTPEGLAAVHAQNHGWLFVRRDGSTIPTVTYDNGPDDFKDGLARYTAGNKIGFIDTSGKVAIKADFEHAFPFENGYAIVGNGGEVVQDGEYATIKGGSWGCIDKKGNPVLPLKFSQQVTREKLVKLKKASP